MKRSLLYLAAALLILLWVIGVFIYTVGFIIHLLLIAAGILIGITLIRRRKINRQKEQKSSPSNKRTFN
jgi:hypothetical protein